MYKEAFMIVNNGKTECPIGNYDNLADLRNDHPKEYFDC